MKEKNFTIGEIQMATNVHTKNVHYLSKISLFIKNVNVNRNNEESFLYILLWQIPWYSTSRVYDTSKHSVIKYTFGLFWWELM